MIEHVLAALKGLFDRVIIVTNSPHLYAAYDALVVRDALDKRGPLTGIYSGMLNSSDDCHFVVGCDMPFLNRGLISYMTGLAAGFDVVVPRVGGLLEPLHAVYRKSVFPAIEARIRQDRRRIRGIFDEVNVRYVEDDEIVRFDPGRKSFVNLNTPADYKEVLCLDWECRN